VYSGWIARAEPARSINFAKFVLKEFDLRECKVAYYKVGNTYFHIRHNVDYTKKQVLNFSASRMKKYNSRVKTPNSLKWLCMTEIKTHYDSDDVEKFINKIDITF